MLKGLLLKESLNDTQVLEILTLTKTETWNVENPADYQPAVWTAVSFEADERQADVIAEQLSRALKPAWFINASSVAYVYVMFPGKVFKYHKGDRAARATAYQHGLSIGIPARQLDWSE